jgi:outer membrane protein insertion porin family
VTRRSSLTLLVGVVLLAPHPCEAQGEQAAHIVDSIAAVGARRNDRRQVIQTSGLVPGRSFSYRDVQRAIRDLYATGEYDGVQVHEQMVAGRRVLVLTVHERPLLVRWSLRGVAHVPESKLRAKAHLAEGRPLDPAGLVRAAGHLDSVYRADGYYLVRVRTLRVYDTDSTHVRVTFDIDEGHRVAIARVDVEGTKRFRAAELLGAMKTKPEGFWWFRSGEYDDDKLREDVLDRLPKFYGDHGYVDFRVLSDTLIVNDTTGKARLVLRVSEGEPRRVGTFEIVGNRRFSTEELERLYPFAGAARTGLLGRPTTEGVPYFDQGKWDFATRAVQTLYVNNGYIYVALRPDVVRRTERDGKPVVDLRWMLTEGQPATVNRVEIVGNELTRDRVIRDAITMLPGDVFRQDALVRSYQNISNLGFFDQPLPFPETRPANDQGDVDIIFRVTEKHTGQVNFGASLGQGTGIGGFVGLEEPNLFGQGKRGRFQVQLGQNLNQVDLSYTDPAIRESRISGTVDLHDTRVIYVISNLGSLRTRGGSLQLGFPAFGDRYSRMGLSYALEVQTFTGTSADTAFAFVFGCNSCLRSTVGATLSRDTRIDLPFPSAGTFHQISIAQSGGPLGGTGDFQRVDLQGHWYATLATLGAAKVGGMKFVLGLSARSGLVFGNAPFFNQLFAMGGTQFGIPLRGYDEFSITPRGFDPATAGGIANPRAFGKAFLAMTGEVGVRISGAFYLSTFYDAGNVWANAADYNPTRLLRGAGVGLNMVSPVGPVGVALAYGFDRRDASGRPAPGWKVHFIIGTLFNQQ